MELLTGVVQLFCIVDNIIYILVPSVTYESSGQTMHAPIKRTNKQHYHDVVVPYK